MKTTEKQIEVTTPDVREKFEDWIANRGGIKVWENQNLSNPGAGPIFTPAFTEDGHDYPYPKWSHTVGFLVTDIGRFRFVKSFKEVKRFHVGIRRSSNGLMMKVTDGGSRRIRRALAKANEQYGQGAFYEFDYWTQDAVILVPEWED